LRPLPAGQTVEQFYQDLRRDRLGEVAVKIRLSGFALIFLLAVAAQRDQRYPEQLGVGAQRPRHPVAVHAPGKTNIA
jgi:hypothetical protein